MDIEIVLAEESFLPEPVDTTVTNELVTIVGNLIDNALEAVKDSAQRQVDVLIAYNNHSVAIEVLDSGPGMDPELVDQMFVKGYSTKSAGRGFGLFLVARAIERLNGQVQVFTKPDAGTCFKIVVEYVSQEADT